MIAYVESNYGRRNVRLIKGLCDYNLWWDLDLPPNHDIISE